jgi:hypothetical protein
MLHWICQVPPTKIPYLPRLDTLKLVTTVQLHHQMVKTSLQTHPVTILGNAASKNYLAAQCLAHYSPYYNLCLEQLANVTTTQLISEQLSLYAPSTDMMRTATGSIGLCK